MLLANATTVANTQGGAHNASVTVVPYPNVAHKVGKNMLKLRPNTMQNSSTANHHTLPSLKAKNNPDKLSDLDSISSVIPSSVKRLRARRCSRGVRKFEFTGKSGRTKKA